MTVLVNLRPGLTLEAQAAASWARMEAGAGRALDVNRSTVSRASQQLVYDKWVAYLHGGPKAPFALPPDESWHCEPRARAVDTDDDVWIREHPQYGWRFVVRDEKWHAQYYPEHDQTTGDEDMPLTPADKQLFKDAMFEFYRDVATPPSGYSEWPFFAKAVWGQPIQAQDGNGFPLTDSEGKPIYFAASGYLSSISATVNAGATVDVAALVAQIEAAGIADLVADELAKRLSA